MPQFTVWLELFASCTNLAWLLDTQSEISTSLDVRMATKKISCTKKTVGPKTSGTNSKKIDIQHSKECLCSFGATPSLTARQCGIPILWQHCSRVGSASKHRLWPELRLVGFPLFKLSFLLCMHAPQILTSGVTHANCSYAPKHNLWGCAQRHSAYDRSSEACCLQI